MTDRTHLWEVSHAYYCNLGNYFDNACGTEYKSWADFIEAEGDADPDYNLVFRWDWKEEGECTFKGDVNYRNGSLEVFWMGQREGLYRYTTVEVCRADEEAVRAFLEPGWEHLKALWVPLS
jgi:hypothetical protein